MFLKKNDQYSVECYTRISKDCLENGRYCNSKEEARDWVEDKCWIYSGEGWICIKCNEHFMRNLAKRRRDKQQDNRDDDLFIGIETVR